MGNSYRKALWEGKCPACREGLIFKYPISQLRRFSEMHKECPVCGEHPSITEYIDYEGFCSR